MTAGTSALVAVAGVAAVLVYRYIDVGAFGPFPNMYESFCLVPGEDGLP